jgi:ABC-type multidrug transport system fused ATPase/permease subunit
MCCIKLFFCILWVCILQSTVSDVALQFLYLGVAAMVAAFLQNMCWMVTGNRMANRLRQTYLRAVLRQDIEFFDTKTSSGMLGAAAVNYVSRSMVRKLLSCVKEIIYIIYGWRGRLRCAGVHCI